MARFNDDDSFAPENLHRAVLWAESRGNPDAVSPKGAVGTMQTMPDTLDDPGFGVRPARSDTPEEWERVGHDYLDAMYRRYKGNEAFALAAYNWGPGNADRWIKNGADPSDLPDETRNYIQQIIGGEGEIEPEPPRDWRAAAADMAEADDWRKEAAPLVEGLEVPDFDSFMAGFDQQSEEPMAPAEEKSDFMTGLKTTFKQLPELGWGLAAIGAAGLESIVGAGGLATRMKEGAVEKYQGWAEEIAKDHTPNHEWDKVWADAKAGDFDSMVDFLAYGTGYAVGQGAQILGTAGVGALAAKTFGKAAVEKVAGGMVAKEAAKLAAGKEIAEEVLQQQAVKNVAARIGAQAGMAGFALGMEGGEIGGDLAQQSVEEGRELTGSEMMRWLGSTVLAGSMEYAADALGLGAMTGKLAGGISSRVGRAALSAGIGSVGEGVTEYAQTGVEEFGKGKEDTLNPFGWSDETHRQAGNAAALGAVGGGVMGGVGGGLSSPQAEPQAEPAPPTDEDIVSGVMASETTDDAIATANAMVDAAPIQPPQPPSPPPMANDVAGEIPADAAADLPVIPTDSAGNELTGPAYQLPNGTILSKDDILGAGITPDALERMGAVEVGPAGLELNQTAGDAGTPAAPSPLAQPDAITPESVQTPEDLAGERDAFAEGVAQQMLGPQYEPAKAAFFSPGEVDGATDYTGALNEGYTLYDQGQRGTPPQAVAQLDPVELERQKLLESRMLNGQQPDEEPTQESFQAAPPEPTRTAMQEAFLAAKTENPKLQDLQQKTADEERGFQEMEQFRQQELREGEVEAKATMSRFVPLLTEDGEYAEEEAPLPPLPEKERIAGQKTAKPLADIRVEVSAFDEDGNEAVYEDSAENALKDHDERLDTAKRLLDCLRT